MSTKVSVVIPAYNHELFIQQTINSVLQQTHQNFELIVIDDGSTDSTGDILKRIEDPRLLYIYQENQDAFNALNRGLEMVSGEYVAILNSDDVYADERLEILIQAQQRSGAHCLFTDVIPIDDFGNIFSDPNFGWNQWHQKNRHFYFQSGDLYTAFLKGNFMVTTSNLFLTREAAEKVGQFCSLRYLHDYDYIFRVMLEFPNQVLYLHDQQLLSYRIHSGNTLSEAAILGREQDQYVIKKYLLAGVPEELRALVAAGSERLVELEQELADVRAQLTPPVEERGIKQQGVSLLRSVKRKYFT